MTTPQPLPPRPVIRCWHTPQDRQPPPPGTITQDNTGTVDFFVGTTFAASQEEVDEVATRLRTVAEIRLIGNMWKACRPWKRALSDSWNRAKREAALAARQAAGVVQPAGPHPRCGRPRADGQPCRQYAGHGADDPAGPCRAHGGTTLKREAEAEALVGKALRWVELSRKARTEPLTPAERLEGLVAMRDMVVAQRKRRR